MKKVVGALAALAASGATFAACSQNAITAPIRSFERADRAAFLCVDATAEVPGRALESCRTVAPALAFNNFATAPHTIGLVTQTTRGELAVVDITAGQVVDADRSIPGFNFFPVGNLPTDVVASPGSNAAFVATADPTRPAVFGIPTRLLSPMLLRDVQRTPPTLATLPTCSLPAAPGEMKVLLDRTPGAVEGTFRARCDGAAAAASDGPLASEAAVFGTVKLAITLPERGEIIVVDAASVLAAEPGSFEPCAIERVIALSGDPGSGNNDGGTVGAIDAASTPVSESGSEGGSGIDVDGAAGLEASSAASDASPADASWTLADAVADGALSVADATIEAASADGRSGDGGGSGADAGSDALSCSIVRPGPTLPRSTTAHPQHLALSDDGRLFVSDDRASVIHVIDVADPCAAVEMAPLVPTSVVDPARAVVTGALAVSPLTTDQKRFVYAVDLKDNGTLMVFDVSSGSTQRTPILRPDLAWNHDEPADRFVMPAPVQSLTFARREVPLEGTQQNGTFERGQRCDPTNPSDPYRTQEGITGSAGPATLRGLFAFVTLASGRVQVLDVDDLDAACRRPRGTDSAALGCPQLAPDDASAFPAGSGEASCNVVERHRPRSSQLISVSSQPRRAPTMQNFAQLQDHNGAVLSVDPQRPESNRRPKMLGPDLSALSPGARRLVASVNNAAAVENFEATFSSLPYANGSAVTPAPNNWVAFDQREPRVHVDQTWTVTYEGAIGNFQFNRGRLVCADPARVGSPTECERGEAPSHFMLYDSSAGFCDRGVQGTALARSLSLPAGDTLQIVEPFPLEDDPYWQSTGDLACTRALCEAKFGPPTLPSPSRDLEIEAAFQDHLVLRPSRGALPGAPDPALACCFPYPLSYAVRGGKQWVVNGGRSGFEHHLVPDPAGSGACTLSCDPNLALLNGRVAGRRADAPVLGYDDPRVFRNAQMRFVVWEPPCISETPSCVLRDWSFRFDEVGGFVAQSYPLAPSATVLPQSTQFVPGLSQLAIVTVGTDSSTQGLVLFELARLGRLTSFF